MSMVRVYFDSHYGTVSISPSSPSTGDTVTVTVVLDGIPSSDFNGWYLDGQKVQGTESPTGTITTTFTMPDGDLYIFAFVNQHLNNTGSLEDALNSIVDIANNLAYDKVAIADFVTYFTNKAVMDAINTYVLDVLNTAV